jgi:cell division septation protein DedD
VSFIKTAAGVVVGIIALGVVSNGGPARRPDGTVDVGATVDQGAQKGGEMAGQAADGIGNSLGNGVGSAIGSSDLAKVAAAGAAAAGVVKYGPKITRPTIKLKPIEEPSLTPTTKPKAKPETTQPTTATTSNPMSSGGFTVPSLAPLPTWKPCLATPGILVDC